ncbi:MAG: LEA type 2 family protein [Treponema sp.]|jgi:LEA14-like dessication related protein|nr:LEA type 2 family protein [Treponema sp.]
MIPLKPGKSPDRNGLWFVRFLPFLLILSCAGTPRPGKAPLFSLEFDRFEVSGPDQVSLYFILRAENPLEDPVLVRLDSYALTINGGIAAGISRLELEEARIGALARGEVPARLDLDLKKAALDQNVHRIAAGLTLNLFCAFEGGGGGAASAEGSAEFPRIRAPSFEISSIRIMQAGLINTRFKVRIRINNPNPFPVDLSAFTYELYGGGRFWAGGTENPLCTVPAMAPAEKELFLVMNFIGMRRDLLDQVIAMRNVRYRFAGTVQIGAAPDFLPSYTSSFELEGESAVTR